jgi:hypothetical protein
VCAPRNATHFPNANHRHRDRIADYIQSTCAPFGGSQVRL